MSVGTPRLHYRRTTSTNAVARELAAAGAPHGTVVTAAEQTAGRGRQGRPWSAPAGRAILCSILVRDPPRLLPLLTGVALAETVGDGAQIKWPNDIWLGGRKVAGILVEGRPQEGWAVVGIGLNVALRLEDFPPELREVGIGMGLEPDAIEPTLARMLGAFERWLAAQPSAVLEAVRSKDALLGHSVRWASGAGRGAGIDGEGRLVVATDQGHVSLDAGEVHLVPAARPS